MSPAAYCSWNCCMNISIFLLSFSSGVGLLLALRWDCSRVLLQALSTTPFLPKYLQIDNPGFKPLCLTPSSLYRADTLLPHNEWPCTREAWHGRWVTPPRHPQHWLSPPLSCGCMVTLPCAQETLLFLSMKLRKPLASSSCIHIWVFSFAPITWGSPPPGKLLLPSLPGLLALCALGLLPHTSAFKWRCANKRGTLKLLWGPAFVFTFPSAMWSSAPEHKIRAPIRKFLPSNFI